MSEDVVVNSVRPLTSYECEHRLAVVMYGGVSLAIYIGGVAKELLSVVRATAPKSGEPSRAGLTNGELRGAEAVYRRIAQTPEGSIVGNVAEDAPILRNVTIDVVSGTSAGGINGIFLAKALANDEEMSGILNLWIQEGDMAKLLNDAESVRDTSLSADNPPVSLLNGRRMYSKLLDAFDGMATDPKRTWSERRYDSGRVDLFVPTTDIRGEVITLPVANTVAREKRHRQRFHFTYDGASRDEFAAERNPVLAYAARCTSSFPFAFEPMTWNDAARVAGGDRSTKADWTSHLMFLGNDYAARPMGDGGYLDNKPFSYALDELARRQSDLEVRRTMFYVEPDPERLDETDALQSKKPDAIQNAMAALISIPGYETIREDLERVVQRNEKVSQLEELEAWVEESLAQSAAVNAVGAADWCDMDMAKLISMYGRSYPAYHKIKIDALGESIADVICSSSGIGRPELAQVIRELVKLWLRADYFTLDDELQLLLDADVDYRLRKIGFILRKTARSKDDAVAQTRTKLKEVYDALYKAKGKMRKDVGAVVQKLRGEVPGKPQDRTAVFADVKLSVIAALQGADRKSEINSLLRSVLDKLKTLPTEVAAYSDLKLYLHNVLGAEMKTQGEAAAAAVASCRAADTEDARTLVAYYERFETFDMVKFPLMQHDGVDEAVRVEVVRISPVDDSMKVKVKVAGKALGHFGAFLEDDWRRNDIVAGRFNASEAIIRQLVPDTAEADKLVEDAHRAIASEYIEELEQRVALAQTKKLIEPLTAYERKQLAGATNAVLHESDLPKLFAEGKVYDDRVDRAKQVRSAGRAGVITEHILRGCAVNAGVSIPTAPRWIAYGAMVLTQIAIPRSIHRTIATYWGRLLALIFVVIALAGYVGGSDALLRAGIKGFVIVTLIAAVVMALSAFIGERLLRTAFRAASFVMAGGVAWYLARTLGPKLGFAVQPLPVRATLATLTVVTNVDVFFIGLAAGLFLMTGLLSVVEDTRTALNNVADAVVGVVRWIRRRWQEAFARAEA